jgi:N-methylhydantoinase A
MGGTTTDVCLIVDGAAEMTDTRMIAGRPMRQPMLAIHSIGAGGGSIVRLGPGGLSVGPESAGSEPGPACYDRGGTLPTITDANAVLGYLDPGAVLGDRIRLDVSRAEAALHPIARELGFGLRETALGILRVANATMARALRRVTVERGVDGRDATLLAFGGGGPMHAASLAEMYGIAEIVVPAASSAFSALGCLTADFSFLQQRTVRLPLSGFDGAAFEAHLRDLTREATDPLVANGVAPQEIVAEHTALMRYAAQSDATAVPFALPADPRALEAAFHLRHRTLYGYATGEPVVIESLRVQARRPGGSRIARPAAGGGPRPQRSRSCTFDNAAGIETPVLNRDTLTGTVHGPAIIEDAWSTTIVPPSWQARPDDAGNLLLTRSAA